MAIDRPLTFEKAERLIATLIEMAELDHDPRNRLAAIRELVDRVEGRPLALQENGEPGAFDVTMDQVRAVLRLPSPKAPKTATPDNCPLWMGTSDRARTLPGGLCWRCQGTGCGAGRPV